MEERKNINKKYKVVIAHPGRHHSFRLASALKKDNNITIKYITTVYNKPNSILMNFIKKFISKTNRERLNNRNNKDLCDDEVIQFYQISGLIEILLSRFDKSKKIYSIWHKITSKKFGIKVAKYAIKNNFDAVICYDTNALECFKYLENNKSNIIRIMDVAATNWIYMKEIYENDMLICPELKEKLRCEVGNYLTFKNQKYIKEEINRSQYLIVASKFVKKSYEFSNFPSNKILICPYGVDLNNFKYCTKKEKERIEPLNFIFIGGTKQLKGIYYLLEAFKRIPNKTATLTIVGECNLSNKFMSRYKNKVTFTGLLMHDDIAELLKTMDIMIFPSLGDGFGLSVIEGMACGCPIICSENSGVADLIKDGENGFIIPIQDIDEIINKVNWFVENREIIPQMSIMANETAKMYSWDNYNVNISTIVKNICLENIYKGEEIE
ncbi:glycosyltransferase family 4 protein [Clostridium perfringens]|nr:glycosyltransferase family 4 protein [Clostridium perfringens]